MSRRHIHYEAAFEDYVRSQGWPYVPVDEGRKAIFSGARIKSFDFLVYRPGKRAWLVDVKGRKFPYVINGTKRYWENWVTREDLEGLRQWKSVFGEDFEPGLMFAYWLVNPTDPEPRATLHRHREENYGFLWISAADYVANSRPRSAAWNTVSVPTRIFRALAKPLQEV